MSIRFQFTLLFLSLLLGLGKAQTAPFSIQLQPIQIEGLGGLQAYAFGRHDGKWLIVGGRLDGLHRRQPFASFDLAGHNNQLIVIDPKTQQKWAVSTTVLPPAIQEQMQSTNAEFYQNGDYLYILGGYGYSATAGDHVTFDKITAIRVSATIEAIINNQPIHPFFRQQSDPAFQVTGGRLLKIGNTYQLAGGQKFMGRYNPMGPTHGPGFEQAYTNQVRRFTLLDDGINLQIQHLPAFTDSTLLHRRDYNAAPQMMPDGSEGITLFSGVFQTTVDLPYLNCVNVTANDYAEQPGFAQYYNHYHSAVLPLYDAENNEMHTVFFGGIAQFYDSSGVLIQDNNVPFVRTIARVTRQANGTMTEYKLPVEMPGLLGASAEWIPAENLPTYPNEVLKMNEFPSDTTTVGYIYGGIASSAPNIFWINTGVESAASATIFEVKLIQNSALSAPHIRNVQSNGALRLQVFPNPAGGLFYLKFHMKKTGPVQLRIQDLEGRILLEERWNAGAGEQLVQKTLPDHRAGKAYVVSIATEQEQASIRVAGE